MLTNGAEADGKAVWSWHPLLVSSWRRSCEPNRAFADRSFADDGGKTNSSPRRARNKPLKPLRRECRAIRCTPGFELVCFFDAHEAMGATGTRHSLRPPLVEGGSHRQQLERDPRCGMVDLYLISEIVSTSSSRRRPGSITTGLDDGAKSSNSASPAFAGTTMMAGPCKAVSRMAGAPCATHRRTVWIRPRQCASLSPNRLKSR